MTKKQKERAGQPIRVIKILAAVKWLCANHVRWRNIDYDKYERELENYTPTIVDHSKDVASENANIENEEIFSCYYPDGAVNTRQGGFNNVHDFKGFIDELHSAGFNVELQVNLGKKFVNGSDGDQLISSCLLQFPYGIGGLDEHRQLPNGQYTEKAHLEAFMSHLTLVGQDVFQLPMFQLVVYSLSSKLKLLRRSRFQLRDERKVSALANGLDANSVRASIAGRQTGNRFAGSVASRALLSSVDSMSRGLPHSNEAAKTARAQGQSMQHVLGTPSLFLTVTFDDENSLLMQVMSGTTIDDGCDVSTLPDDTIEDRAKARKELRLKLPGLGALNFEMLLEIVSEQVIGWSMRDHCATKVCGLFGECIGLAGAMEEQGRKTVHVHFSLWIKGFKELRDNLFFGTDVQKRLAKKIVPEYCEHISSTELIGSGSHRRQNVMKAFDHEGCLKPLTERAPPNVVDDQGLRNLRHQKFYQLDSRFATCGDCGHPFTYEDLVGLHCRRIGQIGKDPGPLTQVEAGKIVIPKDRMHAECIAFQMKKDADCDDAPVIAINAAYNSHASDHVTGCFRCQKKRKRSHTCVASADCECRYRMPDRPRKKACIRDVREENSWFEWNGSEKKQPLVEILPKRHTYDLFQNVSCHAISESKLTCNSNISIITDGPVGQYQFKYIMKSTQDDDTAAYSLVEQSIKSLESRVHEDDQKEACRRICRAAFAHNKGNVIGPGLASYLCRHDSRFYFSHDFQFCPLSDLRKALKNEKVSSTVVYGGGKNDHYLENYALHYLCRPVWLETKSPREFFETYFVKVIRKQYKDDEDDPRFIANTGHFKHPSAKKGKNDVLQCRQGVEERENPLDIQISQWSFPDSARFKSNLLHCPMDDVNDAMEEYAELMVLMFYNYRSMSDLEPTVAHPTYPFVKKLREIAVEENLRFNFGEPKRVFAERNLEFLQNVQNSAYNSLRYKVGKDDLQSVTNCFKPSGGDACDFDENHVDDSDDEDDIAYEIILDNCDSHDGNDQNPEFFHEKLIGYSFRPIRNGGFHGCGHKKNIPRIKVDLRDLHFLSPTRTSWVKYMPLNVNLPAPSIRFNPTIPKWKVPHLVDVTLRRSQAKSRRNVFDHNPNAEVKDATGTMPSIIEWANAAKLDPKQKRAFEAIISAFLLTFHEFEGADYDVSGMDDSKKNHALKIKAQLFFLKGGDDAQLIMLLHGMGGSGKSMVICLVICYAQEFCDHLGHPFTIRTIVIAALTGVAATLLHGETIHLCMGINRKRLKADMIDAWADTRLVIIDECSFASFEIFTKIENHARILKVGNAMEYFGGLNVVYSGNFSQLEPPCRDAIYVGDICPAFQGVLNSFIELDGQHRFHSDPAFGAINMRLRNGTADVSDIRTINKNCTLSSTHQPSENIPVAVYRNRNRDAINCAMFEEYCEDNLPEDDNKVFTGAMLVFMDELQMRDYAKTFVPVTSNEVKAFFYRNCGEHACKTGDMTSGRVDPVLKLYPGCPMMLTENADVLNGQANGSRVTLKQVNVRCGEQPMVADLACGTQIFAFFAAQITSIKVRHEIQDIEPAEFEVKPKKFTFQAKITLDDEVRSVRMKGMQFPIISNGVTTGHKLQGCTLRQLAVFEQFYGQNWMYVVLSRVRTMKGLFLAEPLSEDMSKYAKSAEMKAMIAEFQSTIGMKMYSEQEYNAQL